MRGLVWALAISSNALLVAPSVGAQSRDDDLVDDVRRALTESGFESLRVRVRDGVVILSGSVESAREKILAIQTAFTVPELEAIDTELRLRVGVTPDVEEAIWFTLMQDGLDAGIEEILVENGVASVSGRVADAATRDRVLAIARRADGVEAVTSAIVVAAADAAEPESGPEPRPEPEPRPAPPPAPAPATDVPPEPQPAPPPEAEPRPAAPEPDPGRDRETPAPEPALDVPRPPDRTDLARDIAERIVSHPDYTVFDHVQFSLDGADVALSGSVTSEAKKESIEATVASVPGVASVTNDLHVLSSASEDRRLRERLFRRIYEDPSFAAFADLPNPPIHIIVDGRYVTLTGIVDTRILQMSAEAIVRTTFGVRAVRNQIRVRR